MKLISFIKGRLKGFIYAYRGAFKLITTEHSIITQFCISIIAIIVGFISNISSTEWMFQIFAMGLVLSVEGLNTAIEKIADFIHPDYHEKIGIIKDIAAGAVFFAALNAIAIGLIIYLPIVIALI